MEVFLGDHLLFIQSQSGHSLKDKCFAEFVGEDATKPSLGGLGIF
jgi:hypothetical protein